MGGEGERTAGAMKSRIRACVREWAWLCPFVMLGLAAGILVLFGLTVWTASLVVILLVCPAIMIWGVLYLRRHAPKP
jgi:phosphoethanolamine N-methyltransferase